MRLALFASIAFLTACTQPPPPDTREADTKAIKEVESAWVKAAASKNLDAYVSFFTDDASVLTPNEPLLTGKQPIKDSMKPLMDDPNFTMSFIPNKVEVAKSGDLAFTQGPYKMSFSDMRGNKFEDEGKYLTVWRKQADGTWKAVENSFMTDLPLPPPPN